MSLLTYHLYTRAAHLWSQRTLPSYLGPSIWAISHLLVLITLNSLVLFALLLLFIHAAHSLATNTTQIEGWEVDRHTALVSRAKKNGGWVHAPSGVNIRIVHQEFPYDVGVWRNLVQGMGSSNPIMWFLPFGSAPKIETAKDWEENGFEDEGTMWPPLDPDKMPRKREKYSGPIPGGEGRGFLEEDSREDDLAAFKKRQEADLIKRRGVYTFGGEEYRSTSNMFADEEDENYDDDEDKYTKGLDGEEGWTNAEGERLRDFGVDEDAEDEDDIPLAELLRRRRARVYEA